MRPAVAVSGASAEAKSRAALGPEQMLDEIMNVFLHRMSHAGTCGVVVNRTLHALCRFWSMHTADDDSDVCPLPFHIVVLFASLVVCTVGISYIPGVCVGGVVV